MHVTTQQLVGFKYTTNACARVLLVLCTCYSKCYISGKIITCLLSKYLNTHLNLRPRSFVKVFLFRRHVIICTCPIVLLPVPKVAVAAVTTICEASGILMRRQRVCGRVVLFPANIYCDLSQRLILRRVSIVIKV